jgi:hypothetical protein
MTPIKPPKPTTPLMLLDRRRTLRLRKGAFSWTLDLSIWGTRDGSYREGRALRIRGPQEGEARAALDEVLGEECTFLSLEKIAIPPVHSGVVRFT